MQFIIDYFWLISLATFLLAVIALGWNARGTGTFNAIMMSCRVGDIDNVRYHLRCVRWLAHKPDPSGQTPLHIAALQGHTEIVHLLLNYKADPNAQNSSGMTALHAAAMAGRHETAKILLAARAKINLCDNCGNTPLYLAVWDGHIEMVKLLLKEGADLNIKNIRGESAICRAAKHGHIEISRILKLAPKL